MEYDRILLAQGSVRASTNLIIGYGSTISAELTPGVENTCLVIEGDLGVKGELCLDDGQGLIVLGDIRVREFFSGDAELSPKHQRDHFCCNRLPHGQLAVGPMGVLCRVDDATRFSRP